MVFRRTWDLEMLKELLTRVEHTSKRILSHRPLRQVEEVQECDQVFD